MLMLLNCVNKLRIRLTFATDFGKRHMKNSSQEQESGLQEKRYVAPLPD